MNNKLGFAANDIQAHTKNHCFGNMLYVESGADKTGAIEKTFFASNVITMRNAKKWAERNMKVKSMRHCSGLCSSKHQTDCVCVMSDPQLTRRCLSGIHVVVKLIGYKSSM